MFIFFSSDIDGVLKSANGTEYGLASGVFTKDLSKVWFNFFKASLFFSYFTTHSLQRKTCTVEALLMYTLVNGSCTYGWLPSQPHFSQLPYKVCIFTFS